MKLKTLKDIEMEFGDIPAKNILLFEKQLKAEAVKWVKEYKELVNKDGWEILFKKFFNLTEEDFINEL